MRKWTCEILKINQNDLVQDLTEEQKKRYDEGMLNNAFNQYASDMMSIHRSLPDPADQE